MRYENYSSLILEGTILYGCGPSQVIGTLGVIGYGILSIKSKIHAFILTLQLGKLSSSLKEDLLSKIQQLNEHSLRCAENVAVFALGLIPFIAAFVQIKAYTYVSDRREERKLKAEIADFQTHLTPYSPWEQI